MTTKNQPYGNQANANNQLCTVLNALFPQGKVYKSSKTSDPYGFMFEFVAGDTQYTVDCNRRGMSLLKGADKPGSVDTHCIMILSGGVYNDNWLSRSNYESGEAINEVDKAILNVMVPYF